MQLRPHRVSDRSLEFFHHMAYLLPHDDVRAFFDHPDDRVSEIAKTAISEREENTRAVRERKALRDSSVRSPT